MGKIKDSTKTVHIQCGNYDVVQEFFINFVFFECDDDNDFLGNIEKKSKEHPLPRK